MFEVNAGPRVAHQPKLQHEEVGIGKSKWTASEPGNELLQQRCLSTRRMVPCRTALWRAHFKFYMPLGGGQRPLKCHKVEW